MADPETPPVDISPDVVSALASIYRPDSDVARILLALRAALTRAETERDTAREHLQAAEGRITSLCEAHEAVFLDRAEAHRHLETALDIAKHEDGCPGWPVFLSHMQAASGFGPCTCKIGEARAYLARVQPSEP